MPLHQSITFKTLTTTGALLGFLSFAQPTYADPMIDMPIVQLKALDKITARTVTFQAPVKSTVRFGSLYIHPQACKKASPLDRPESAAFLQIWEETSESAKNKDISIEDKESQWVYSGWMFASSPSMAYMDHPIYDVWVIDCLEKTDKTLQEETEKDMLEGEGSVEKPTPKTEAIAPSNAAKAKEKQGTTTAKPKPIQKNNSDSHTSFTVNE